MTEYSPLYAEKQFIFVVVLVSMFQCCNRVSTKVTIKQFFENADVSPFGFFRAVGKNREWGYRKGREREELGKVPRSTKKKKTARWRTEG